MLPPANGDAQVLINARQAMVSTRTVEQLLQAQVVARPWLESGQYGPGDWGVIGVGVPAAPKAGTIWINCYGQIDPGVGFGGYRMSGYGWKGGPQHVDGFLYQKAIYMNLD